MHLVAVIGLTTSPQHVAMNCKKTADEDFVMKANAVCTYRTVNIVCDFMICVIFEAKNKLPI